MGKNFLARKKRSEAQDGSSNLDGVKEVPRHGATRKEIRKTRMWKKMKKPVFMLFDNGACFKCYLNTKNVPNEFSDMLMLADHYGNEIRDYEREQHILDLLNEDANVSGNTNAGVGAKAIPKHKQKDFKMKRGAYGVALIKPSDDPNGTNKKSCEQWFRGKIVLSHVMSVCEHPSDTNIDKLRAIVLENKLRRVENKNDLLAEKIRQKNSKLSKLKPKFKNKEKSFRVKRNLGGLRRGSSTEDFYSSEESSSDNNYGNYDNKNSKMRSKERVKEKRRKKVEIVTNTKSEDSSENGDISDNSSENRKSESESDSDMDVNTRLEKLRLEKRKMTSKLRELSERRQGEVSELSTKSAPSIQSSQYWERKNKNAKARIKKYPSACSSNSRRDRDIFEDPEEEDETEYDSSYIITSEVFSDNDDVDPDYMLQKRRSVTKGVK